MTARSRRHSFTKNHRALQQAAEYMVSGGAYFWTGYAVFWLLDKPLGANFFWAKSLSTLAGWTVNYILQRYWVFRDPKRAGHQTQVTGRYIAITLIDFAMDYAIVWGLRQVGLTPYIGQFVSSAFFTVWNYLWYRFWVFPSQTEHLRASPARVIAHRAHGHSAYKKKVSRKKTV